MDFPNLASLSTKDLREMLDAYKDARLRGFSICRDLEWAVKKEFDNRVATTPKVNNRNGRTMTNDDSN